MNTEKTQPLSELAEINPRVELNGIRGDTLVSFIPMSDVSDSGQWIGRQERRLDEVRSGYTPFVENDVLFAKITPCMENGKGAHATGLRNGLGFGSTEFHVLRVRGGNEPRFLFHWLQARVTRSKAIAYMGGSAGQQRVQADFFCSFQIPRIDPREQTLIAFVLDTVDEAIAKTEALIAKLKQVRAGLLHDLLSRGLDQHDQLRDPIAHPEQFQDSPLGRIPRVWRVCKLGDQLLNPPRNGYSPQAAPVFHARYILGLACLTTEGFTPLQLKNAPLDAGLDPFLLHDGDLLISRSNTRELVASPGLFRDVGYPCYYPDLMMRLVPTHTLSSEFLELVLRHSQSRTRLVASATGTSGSMVKITGAGVTEIPIAFPSRDESDEQQRILAAKHAIDDELRIAVQEISKLKSLKSGLMTDLLTGRVRVREGIAVTG